MQLGFVGLGKMGLNMVTRLVRGGHHVAAFDRSPDAVARADVRRARVASLRSTSLVAALATPRIVWVMVPAGAPTESTVEALARSAFLGRHHHRRRQHQLPRRRPASGDAGGQRDPRTSTPARAAASGDSKEGYLPDGRRRCRRLPPARTDLSDARTRQMAICASAGRAPATT